MAISGAVGNGGSGISDGDTLSTGLTFPNTGLHLLDTNASHDLILAPGSNITADRTLTLTTGDASRTVTLNGDPTLNDWFDQSVKQAASPTFGGLTLNGNLSQADALNIQTDQVRARDGDGLKLYDDGGNGIFVEDGGNVGIGTTGPESELEVRTADTTDVKFTSSGDINTGRSIFQMYRGTVSTATGWDFGNNLNLGDDYFNIRELTSGAAATRVTMTTGGNVGIGTTSPQKALHVVGTILVDGDGGGYAGTIGFTDQTDTPTTDPGWTTSDTVSMNAPDGYIKMYVGTQSVVIPYWHT